MCAGLPGRRSIRAGLEFSLLLSLFQDEEKVKEGPASRQKVDGDFYILSFAEAKESTQITV